MIDIHSRAILILSAAALCTIGAPGSAQPWKALSSKPRPDLAKRPKMDVKCLPPGSSAGATTCATMRRGTTLLITVNEEVAAGTAILRFKARGVAIDRPIGPLRRGQAVRVAVPAELCAGPAAGQFEIQHLMSQYNQSESPGHADSVGFFQMRCD